MTLDVGAICILVTGIYTSALVDIFTDCSISAIPIETYTRKTSGIIEAGGICIAIVQIIGRALVYINTGDSAPCIPIIASAHKVPIMICTGGFAMAIMPFSCTLINV